MSDKLRAWMPVYVGDWMSSSRIELMSLEEEGAYLRLLMRQWGSEHGDLPDDDGKLAVLSRAGNRWKSVRVAVLEMFEASPRPGYIRNRKLHEVWVDQRGKYVALSEAGKRGMEKRWGGKDGVSKLSSQDSQVSNPVIGGLVTKTLTGGYPKDSNQNQNQSSTPISPNGESGKGLENGAVGAAVEAVFPTFEEVWGSVPVTVGMPEAFARYWYGLREVNGDWLNGNGRLKIWRLWVVKDWLKWGREWQEREEKRRRQAGGSGPGGEAGYELECIKARLLGGGLSEAEAAELRKRWREIEGS